MDAAVIADVDCIITGLNQAACDLFGYTKEELIGKNVSVLMPGM